MSINIDRERATAAFDAYVAAYDATNQRIKLKIDHTYRVAELCDRIARSLGLSSDDVDLAWLCGLLHDIGRFEQVRRWDTFSDAKSASHALIGVSVLFGAEPGDERSPIGACAGNVRDFVADASGDELIRVAVETHSDFRLPADLDDRTRTFCDILRDADKVDIINAACLEPPEAIFGSSERDLCASTISPAVIGAFDERRTVRRDERRTPADVVVSFACFVFELVYPESVRIAREQGRIFELLARDFDDETTRGTIAQMEARLRTWMDEKASC